MLGFRAQSSNAEKPGTFENGDVAKLFFDAFSGRLTTLETNLKLLSADVEKLKLSGDQSRLSDLVLFERLQKSEKILQEALNWIRQVADTVLQSLGPIPAKDVVERDSASIRPGLSSEPMVVAESQTRHDPSIVQPGTLNSITTPTELQVLTLLVNEGPKSAPDIGKFVGRSREHTARLMKKLFNEGYVKRDQTRIPFRYSTVERVKNSLTKPVQKSPGQEVASPQP